NAILIVEFAKAKREEGVDRREATLAACQLRLRPIIMTSFAFILGVVPLMLSAGAGAEMRRTLGTAVFSGMLGVTLFGIFLTPVFYYMIQWFADRRAVRLAVREKEEERLLDAAAQVGKGTLYRYFRDKEELYEGLLAHATAQFRARMHAEVDRASSARAQLEALVQAGIDYFDEHPHLKGLIQRAEAAHDEG